MRASPRSGRMAAQARADFTTRVVAAATQGSVGAVIAAGLSSVTEPIVNRILVERLTLGEALKHLSAEQIARMFQVRGCTEEERGGTDAGTD